MTLAIIMLKNIFLLHTKRWDYQLNYPDVLLQMSYCRYFFHLKKLLILTNGITLAIGRLDTSSPLNIYFRPFADSVRDTKHHKQRSVQREDVIKHTNNKCHAFTF